MNRTVTTLKYGFRFYKQAENEEIDASAVDFDDSGWETVRVPHDWAAAGEFDEMNDVSYNEVIADGITNKMRHTGRTGGLPSVGTGWYRVHVELPDDVADKNVMLELDGVMWHSVVYCNGEQVGSNHYGYTSYAVDLSAKAVPGDNVIAVKATVAPNCSRWYCGGGIYRNVRLIVANKTHFEYNGICIRTPEIGEKAATVSVTADFVGNGMTSYTVIAPDGSVAAQSDEDVFTVKDHKLWSIEEPNLYTLRAVLTDENGEVCDCVEQKFGFRTFSFDCNEGFFLNGVSTKFKGVCLHHDLGSIGAAVNKYAMRRQLRILGEMGCNAIRTSHNPPAPELLELCDEMGFMVVDEMFDEWQMPKIDNGYYKCFDQYAEQDLTTTIRRDRNHPCIIIWSIGNEMNELAKPHHGDIARFLVNICHREDPTRPVTAGCNYRISFQSGIPQELDIVGWNYKPFMYRDVHIKYPGVIQFGSETASCVSNRGEYRLPAVIEAAKPYEDLSVSAYDLVSPAWANHCEVEFVAQDDFPYVCGEFVWTGFDYLGEPTPYYYEWPSRSSYFGIVDLAGIPKNRYYLYQSRWSNKDVLCLFPHWNWAGHEGENIPVHCYTSFKKAELFLNGRSLGIQVKDENARRGEDINTVGNPLKDFAPVKRYRLIWDNVPYEPGTLLVVAYNDDGTEGMRQELKTAGEPYAVELEADLTELPADGDALVYVTAKIVDADGNVCPLAKNRVKFSADGAAEIIATDNGDPRDVESFANHSRCALSGMCVGTARSILGKSGECVITAESDGLKSASVTVKFN